MLLQSLLKNSNGNQQMQYAKLMNGYTPNFSQFGDNIYASDLVQMCIDAIATEMSKLRPKHIRIGNDGIQTIPRGSLNRLFKIAPNSLMTTRDFIEKIIWKLYADYNSFVYPKYETRQDERGTYIEYTAFYPLNPAVVEFLQDATGKLFIKMTFANGSNFTLAYSDVIHLRKKFSVNDVMGGGFNGQPDNAALLKVLEINDTVLQGLGKAVKSSLSIRGVLKINTMMDDAKQQAERKRLEKAIDDGVSGILPMDLKGDYVPLNSDPKLIDKDTMEFLQSKVLNWYGVSMPILHGDFTEEQYQAFYEKTLEPLIISLGQAFSKTIFTTRELDVGNEIVFYQKDMMYLSTKNKLDLLKTSGEQGLLSDNQKLAILGYPPLEDGSGNRRTMSLNYIDVNLVNDYQMTKAKSSQNNQGGKE